MLATPPIKKCLVPVCKKLLKTRGLCYVHYNQLMKRIHKGELTWQQAEEQGLCLPAKPRQTFMVGFALPGSPKLVGR